MHADDKSRESVRFDVLIIGAGPAGLSAAIRLAQQHQKNNIEKSIAIIEKGPSVGAHSLSGAVLDVRALDELLPDWKTQGAPIAVPVQSESFYYLTAQQAWRLPILANMRNEGNVIISLGRLCAWLGEQAEKYGVTIFPSFAGQKILYDEKNRVVGVQTGDMGLSKTGYTKRYQPGINIYADYTVFAEGCRGFLSESVIQHYHLRAQSSPQTYALGIKELWQIPKKYHKKGYIWHSVGWPLCHKTYGGSFVYHYEEPLLALGLVVGLDYQNPYLDPFQELQRFKHHPIIKPLLQEGKCIGYGARALNEGGFQSIPKLTFPGGLLIGCAAGFLNVAKLKGIHNAMKSGILAADIIAQSWDLPAHSELTGFEDAIKNSWIAEELWNARNIRPSFRCGLWPGLMYSAIDQRILRGNAPWTFKHQPDYRALKKADQCRPIIYPKPDGKISFDKLTQVYLSNTSHREDEPAHLLVRNADTEIQITIAQYGGPEQYYCPAAVYEILEKNGSKSLKINAANCIHCKTCDIKDPMQNIHWTPPEGGEGPHYTNL